MSVKIDSNTPTELEWYKQQIGMTYAKLIEAKKVLSRAIKDYIGSAMKNTEMAYDLAKETNPVRRLERVKRFREDTKALKVMYLVMVDCKTKVLCLLDTLSVLKKERKEKYESLTRKQN